MALNQAPHVDLTLNVGSPKKPFFTISSLVAQMLKKLPAVWDTQVRSLGQKDPLEKGMNGCPL